MNHFLSEQEKKQVHRWHSGAQYTNKYECMDSLCSDQRGQTIKIEIEFLDSKKVKIKTTLTCIVCMFFSCHTQARKWLLKSIALKSKNRFKKYKAPFLLLV